MTNRALASLIIGHIWCAAAVIIHPDRWPWALLAAAMGLGWLGLSYATERTARRRQAVADNLARSVAAARYREATDGR